MTAPDVLPGQPLLAAFDQQAQWCRDVAPFTAALLQRGRRWLEHDPAAAAALCRAAGDPADPLAAALPLRWTAALHHLALRGLAPWAGLWPPAAPVASASRLDGLLDEAIAVAWQQQRTALDQAMARPPQTNEVQRSAVLLPGLLHVAQATGLPLALCEIGASAGLNLYPDRYLHRHCSPEGPGWSWGDALAPVQLDCTWIGAPPALQAPLRVASRAACDRHPVQLVQPSEALRLASFVWPEQRDRLVRLQAALAAVPRWLQEDGQPVRAQSAAAFVAEQLEEPRPGQATVLMHSVVWQYLPAEEQQAIRGSLQAAAARATAQAPLAWLRMEPPTPSERMELRCMIWPGRGDQTGDQRLATVHPHGLRIEWGA